eukprot:6871572-Prymnesium_polylepis.1
MLYTVEEAWMPVAASRSFIEEMPKTLIPAVSDCWGILEVAADDAKMMRSLVRAMPQAAQAMGVNVPNQALPAG